MRITRRWYYPLSNNTGRPVGKTDNLLLDKLSDALDDQQKKNKVRNIIYAMANRDKTVVNKGSPVKSVWALASKTF